MVRRMCLLMSALALAAALLPQPASAANELRRFALIAGANDGGETRIRLSYADDDARSFHRVLAEMGGWIRATRCCYKTRRWRHSSRRSTRWNG